MPDEMKEERTESAKKRRNSKISQASERAEISKESETPQAADITEKPEESETPQATGIAGTSEGTESAEASPADGTTEAGYQWISLTEPLKDTHEEASPPPAPEPVKKGRNKVLIGLLIGCAAVFGVCVFFLARYFGGILTSQGDSAKLLSLYHGAQTENPKTTAQLTDAASPTAFPAETPTTMPETAIGGELYIVPDIARTPEPKENPSALEAAQAPDGATNEEVWPTVYPANQSLRISSSFYEMRKQNPDIVAYLKIEGVLEEPVVQSDNYYYLTHSIYKQEALSGAVFLDENCDLKTVPSQFVLYGHNMKEGSMFGALLKYRTKDSRFYHEHPFVEFNTLYENSSYVIFAVCEVDVRPGETSYLPYWQISRFDVDEFPSYIARIRSLSQLVCDVDVIAGDRLLVLSTCLNEDSNKRLLVISRRLRDQEDWQRLNIAIYGTGDANP